MSTTQWAEMTQPEEKRTDLQLDDGSKVAVMGGGPAGAFFSYFTLEMAERAGLDITVDVYEPRDFTVAAPTGCNMCGGVISESLVQNLAAEGINLPPTIVQRGIDSYRLHMDVGQVQIDTPQHEKRIASVYRGPGPRDIREMKWGSFDGHLQKLAAEKGANMIRERVTGFEWLEGRPRVQTRGAPASSYDLLAVCIGVNSPALRIFQKEPSEYRPPGSTKTFIREYYLGEEQIGRVLGNSMHVFLLNIPRLEFAAIVPKGDYATVCMLGEDIDNELMDSFLNSREVRRVFPVDWDSAKSSCQCRPKMSIAPATRPFADRLVFVGDCGVTRLYKDGIGAAYRMAKSAATTAVFEGVSAKSFERHYWRACKEIKRDNALGRIIFLVTSLIQKHRFARRAVLKMTAAEQDKPGHRRRMSQVLWDTFTGSAPYREIFLRTLNPLFLGRLAWELALSPFTRTDDEKEKEAA